MLQIIRLPNGVPVICDTNSDFPYVSIQMVFNVSHLSAQELGGLEIVAEAIMYETESFSPSALAEYGLLLGGSIKTETNASIFRIEIITQNTHVRPAILLMNELITRPIITEDILEKTHEKLRFKRLLQLHHPTINFSRMFQEVFGVYKSNIELQNFNDIKLLIEKALKPENLVVIVVGDIKPDEVAKTFSDTIGQWKVKPITRQRTNFKENELLIPSGFVAFGCQLIGPSVIHEDYPAWLVLVSSLTFGKSSAMQKEFRLKNPWAYYFDFHFKFYKEKTSVIIWFLCKSDDIENDVIKQRENVLSQFLKTYSKSLSEEQVLSAKNRIIGFPFALESQSVGLTPGIHSLRTASERGYWYAWWELFGGGIDNHKNFTQKIMEVSHEEVTKQSLITLSNPQIKVLTR